jgi:hypothetical protein
MPFHDMAAIESELRWLPGRNEHPDHGDEMMETKSGKRTLTSERLPVLVFRTMRFRTPSHTLGVPAGNELARSGFGRHHEHFPALSAHKQTHKPLGGLRFDAIARSSTGEDNPC